jgi:hypothetical protein
MVFIRLKQALARFKLEIATKERADIFRHYRVYRNDTLKSKE